MKKIMLTVLLLTAAVFALSSQSNAQSEAQEGIIRDLTGKVELKHSGSANFIPAKAGDAVMRDTIISTDFKSIAIIAIGSSTISVQPLTRLTLSEIKRIEETENIELRLHTGKVRVEVKPPAGNKANFILTSPTSTASVRGTSFEFDGRNLTVAEGAVVFRGNNGMTVVVPADNASYVSADEKAVNPVIISESKLLPPAPIGITPVNDPQPVTASSFANSSTTHEVGINVGFEQ